MKAAVLLFATSALALDMEAARPMFDQWARDNGRNFSSTGEYELRLQNFRANVIEVERLNKIHRGAPSGATFRMNQFADLSAAEFRSMLSFKAPKPSLLAKMGPRHTAPAGGAVPASIDYREHSFPIIAPIQNQGMCGSCWAFSALSNVETAISLAYNRTYTKYSEQQLVDCDQVCGEYRGEEGCDAGCNGGLMPNAWVYLRDNALMTQAEYPYTGSDDRCKANGPPNGLISGFDLISQNEEDIKEYIAKVGPLAIAVDASQWSFYFGGVMTYLCWGKTEMENLNHAVNIVGYGTTPEGVDYWLIRNSWSTMWGESGYARILRGTGFCGVNLFACTATIRV